MNGLILIIAVLVGVYLVFKVASKLIKGVGLVLVVFMAWYFWQGGTVGGLANQGLKLYFANTPITEMKDKFCEEEKKEKFRCQCVVTPIYEDLQSRLSKKEIREIDQDTEIRYQEIKNSIDNQRKAIKDCLIQHEGEEGVEKVKDFLDKIEIK